MTSLSHLAQRLWNTPLAVSRPALEVVARVIGPRFGIGMGSGNGAPLALATSDGFDARDFAPPDDRGPGYANVDRIAVIDIHGLLVHKLGRLRPFCGITGYDGVEQNLAAALDDPSIEAIVLDIDSPGGEVAGAFDLADIIFAARGQKPIRAILTESAFSAAYAIASAADRVTVPRTGGTGSIGVIAMHVDFSGALKQAGITVTMIQYGARKSDLAESAKLGSEAARRLQADINRLGALFDETVARNRRMAAARVRSFEAATFLGAAGVAAGLADAVMAPSAAFAELCRDLDRGKTNSRAPAGRHAAAPSRAAARSAPRRQAN